MNKKILYLIQLPPPLHGASKINFFVYHSKLINLNIEPYLVELKFCNDLTEIGKFSWRKIIYYIVFLKKLITALSTKDIDFTYFTINVTGNAFYRDFLIAMILKLFRVKIIYHLHGTGVAENCKNKLKKFLYRLCFNHSHIITVAPRLANTEFQDLDLKNAQIYSAENGIPIIEYNVNNQVIIKKDKIYLLFLSILTQSKGIYVLLEALALLKQKNYPIHLDVIGGELDKNEPAKIKHFIQAHQLNDFVTLHGPIYDITKYEYLSKADIFIHPTLNDSFGLVILEAMQFAKPVISTIEGGIPNIIEDGITGYLVEKNNAAALAEKIELLIKNPQQQKEMGCKGRQRFLNYFTEQHFEKRMADIFKKITNEEA